MPPIPRAERTRTVSGVSGNVPTSISSAGAEGRALSQTADTFTNVITEHATRIKQQDDRNQEILLRSEYDDERRAYRDDEVSKLGSDSYGSIERGEKFRSDMVKKYTEKIKSPELKSAMTGYITSRSNSLLDSLSIHQSKQRSTVNEQARDSALESIMKDSFSGTPLDESLALWANTVALQNEAGSISEEDAIVLTREGESVVAESHLEGLIDANPTAGIAAINDGVYDEYLSADKQEEFKKRATALEKAQETDARVRLKERDRIEAKILKEAQKQTGNDFLVKITNGTLTEEEVLKSNLNPAGDNGKKGWMKAISDREKKLKKAIDETDPEVLAQIQEDIALLPDTKFEEGAERIKADIIDKQLDGLSTTDARTQLNALNKKKEDDPQKTQDARAGYTRLRDAKTDDLYSNNTRENSAIWADSVSKLNRWIDAHPNENPQDYVDQLLEPAKDGVMRRIFDFLPGVVEFQSEAERQVELEAEVGADGEIITPPPAQSEKVTVKIIRKPDGTHEALYPNGSRRPITLDEEGKVSF